MAIDFSKLFERLSGSSPAKEKNDTQERKTESTGLVKGWPFVNFGEDRYKPENYLVLPRPKYTWFAEFDINQEYLKSQRMVTNLSRFLEDDRRLYLNLKRIDHPKPNVTTETLRSYNKYVKVQSKVEYPPAQMTFDDDATSIIVALWKEYFAFYSHTGDVGFEKLLQTNNLVQAQEDDNFSIDKNMGAHGYGHLVSVGGSEPRNSMDIRGSMGMRLKPNAFRHFFERIVIYDLGTEPDSVNIYYYYRPVITAFDHGELDWEDRTGKVEANVTFEYENYYFALGIPRIYVKDVIEKMTGQKVEASFRESSSGVSTTHGDMITPEFAAVPDTARSSAKPPTPVFDQPVPPTIEPGEPPRDPENIQSDINNVQKEWNRLLSEKCSSARNSEECLAAEKEYEERLLELEEELDRSRRLQSEEETNARGDRSTQEALENTEANLQEEDPEPTREPRPPIKAGDGSLIPNCTEFGQTGCYVIDPVSNLPRVIPSKSLDELRAEAAAKQTDKQKLEIQANNARVEAESIRRSIAEDEKELELLLNGGQPRNAAEVGNFKTVPTGEVDSQGRPIVETVSDPVSDEFRDLQIRALQQRIEQQTRQADELDRRAQEYDNQAAASTV